MMIDSAYYGVDNGLDRRQPCLPRSRSDRPAPMLSNHNRFYAVEATALQARMPAIQSVRELLETYAERISVDFLAVARAKERYDD